MVNLLYRKKKEVHIVQQIVQVEHNLHKISFSRCNKTNRSIKICRSEQL
jgi:hypothetical protein